MQGSGELIERVAFQRPVLSEDDYGNETSGWETVFERAAKFLMKPGSEIVQAARLEGRQPIVVIVRYDSKTRTVTPEWRLLDRRHDDRVLAIHSAYDITRERKWIEMMAEAGVAA